MSITLLVGGARAGKSDLAQKMAVAAGGEVTVVATATALDDDMRARIARHRADRPAGWATVEEPLDLARALRDVPPEHTVIVDCLTLWTTNLMLGGRDEDAIGEATRVAVAEARRRTAPVVVVTNEVGLGVVPASPLGARFREVHGAVNRAWSAAATRAFLVVAGRVLSLRAAEEAL